jgi:3-methylcrotonyl-CoA carboxylase beta subunit
MQACFVNWQMAEEFELESVLGSKLDVKAARFGANRAALQVLMAAFLVEEDEIRLGGGAKAAEAQKAKGRLTVRERLALLLDQGSEFLELGLWAAYGMYGEYGGAPAAGVVTGLGRVSGE